MTKLVVATLCLALCVNVFGFVPLKRSKSPNRSRIIGGDEVIPHSLPYQVGLLINGNAFCGGSLISPNFVLTAGHCGIVIRSVTIILGAHNVTDLTETTQQRILGKKVILHQQYDDESLLNDIALVELSQSAELNENVQVIALPPSTDSNRTYFNEVAKASGWGLPHDVRFPTMSDMSDVLLAVNVVGSNLDECKLTYNLPDLTMVADTNVCTSGYQNKGTCDGDSGGPLVVDEKLIGLTSFGTDQCEWCAPSVYTKVASYVLWIKANTDI